MHSEQQGGGAVDWELCRGIVAWTCKWVLFAYFSALAVQAYTVYCCKGNPSKLEASTFCNPFDPFAIQSILLTLL